MPLDPSTIALLLSKLQYKDWQFVLGERAEWVQVQFEAPDNCAPTSPPTMQHGRKWRLSPHMMRSEIVQTCLAAVLAAEEHEAREQFRYRGRAIFGPHSSVDALWALAAAPGDKRSS